MATTDLASIGATNILLSAQQKVAAHPIDEQQNLNNTSQPNLGQEVRGILSQTTTLPGQTVINYVSDINVSAYMRRFPIDFFVYNMRPNRRVFPFFSDVDVTKIIQKPNVVVLDNNKNYFSILPRTSIELARITENIITPNYDLISGQEDLGIELNDVVYPTSWTSSDSGTIAGPIQTQREKLYIGGGIADIFFSEYDENGRTILYISEIVDIGTDLTNIVGNTVVGVRSTSISNVVSYVHNSGILGFSDTDISDLASMTIDDTVFSTLGFAKLSLDASTQDGYYVGNTFTLLNGTSPGETTRITAYEGATRKVTLDPPLRGALNLRGRQTLYYSLGDPRVQYTSDKVVGHYTSSKGFYAGRIHIPGARVTSPYMFRTGEKLFKITDDYQNNSGKATTIAEYIFNSYGLNISRGQIIINNPNSTAVSGSGGNGSTEDAAPLLPAINNGILANEVTGPAPAQGYKKLSPIAQSFYISETDYPKGIFVPYIDLFFATKGKLPVEIQIRPIVNGYPDAKNIVPNAVAVLQSEEVRITGAPDPTNPLSYSRFTFNSPVYLYPGFEYAIIISSNDYDYEIFVSELGEKVIGSNRIVSEQPFLGSLFKSQNGSTYSALQTEDLMFVIHKCEFVSDGQIEFFEEKFPGQVIRYWQDHTYTITNTAFDTFCVHSDSIALPGTDLTFSYRSTNHANGLMDSVYTEFKPDRLIALQDRKMMFGKQWPDISYKMKVTLSTTSKDVSPIIYVEKQNIARTSTLINNLGIRSDMIIIANTGNGYTTGNTSVYISANTGSGGNVRPLLLIERPGANATNGFSNTGTTSKIGGFYIDGQGGGYAEDINITISSTDANVTNAVVTVKSETDPSGGPASCRFISKTVKLAPEFNAGDLRVFLTAIKPLNSSVYVYYKVRNNYDNEPIDNKRWVKLVEKTGPAGELYYTTSGAPIELEYRPSFSSNTIVYSSSTATFNTFNEFKIKIVLSSLNTTLDKIPYVFDMRAIALPGTE
jgi:hypothetical protein